MDEVKKAELGAKALELLRGIELRLIKNTTDYSIIVPDPEKVYTLTGEADYNVGWVAPTGPLGSWMRRREELLQEVDKLQQEEDELKKALEERERARAQYINASSRVAELTRARKTRAAAHS